jgi:hypothetical protein
MDFFYIALVLGLLALTAALTWLCDKVVDRT